MDDLLVWNGSWAWGLPLILLNVIFHVIGLGLVHAKGVGILTIVKNDCAIVAAANAGDPRIGSCGRLY